MNPSTRGTYVLALHLPALETISVGSLGEIRFPAGWYLYVGSALGSGGLRARLARHRWRLAAGKRAHWHVDHLREHALWGGAWARASDERLECTWAAELRRLAGAEVVAPQFGASDCRCPAHLVRLPSLPDETWFARVLGAERVTVADEELDELLRKLTSGEDEARERAAMALKRFGPEAVERLAAMLLQGGADSRWWAARALAELGQDGAVLPLVSALVDADPDVRACVALALGRIGNGSAAAALAGCLSDESAFVASIAADALSMIGELAIEALAGASADRSAHVRLLAVRALSRIRSQGAIDPLFDRLEDPSYLVRYYAQEALEALGVGMVFLTP
jgi:Uri superfamily endonuclease